MDVRLPESWCHLFTKASHKGLQVNVCSIYQLEEILAGYTFDTTSNFCKVNGLQNAGNSNTEIA